MMIERLIELAVGNAGCAAVLALGVLVAARFVRRPAVVHALWLLVLLRLLTPHVLELALLPPAPAAALPLSMVAPVEAAARAVAPAVVRPAVGPRELAVLCWLLGGLGVLGLAGVRLVRLGGVLRQAAAPGADLVQRLGMVARSVGVRAPVARLVDSRLPPMLLARPGRPLLVLPRPLLSKLDSDELEGLLGHELAHLRRRDHWVRYLELAAVVLFWWNPVAWFAAGQMRAAEEECCDTVVASALPEHQLAYARGLVKTMRFLGGRRPAVPAVAAGVSHFRQIERRIRIIMSPTTPASIAPALRVAFVALTVAALGVTPTLTAREGGGPTALEAPAGLRQSAADDPGYEPITLQLKQARLRDVLESIASILALRVAVDPAVEDGRLSASITLDVEREPCDRVLDEVLGQAGLGWTREGSLLWIHPSGSPPAGDRTFSGESISLNLDHADLRDVLGMFGEQSGLEIEVDPAVRGTVTAQYESVPWDKALDLLLRSHGLISQQQDGVLRIRPSAGGSLRPEGDLQRPGLSVTEQLDGAPVYRYIVGSAIVAPQRLTTQPPVYTEEARAAKTEGVVILEVVIDSHGAVRQADVLRGLPNGLTPSALDVVTHWRFEPATLNGEPVAVRYILTVRFQLD